MRVIFMGTPDFAVPTLNAIVEAGHEVVLVVAQPSRPAGRGRKLRAPPVAVRALELGLPLAQPKALRTGPFPERFCSLNADVGVVVAYGRILPDRLLDAPSFGCLNVHGSLLPRWRGAAPIQACLLAGDTITGTCVQQMEPTLDTGPIYEQLQVAIESRETAGSLHDKLAVASAEVLISTLNNLTERTALTQDESKVTWCGKIDKSMGEVDFERPAVEIDRQIRAMSPWPGGWIPWGKGPLKIKRAHPVEGSGPPGVMLSKRPLIIATGEGALQLDEVAAPGRKTVSGQDFANGIRVSLGEVFTCQ